MKNNIRLASLHRRAGVFSLGMQLAASLSMFNFVRSDYRFVIFTMILGGARSTIQIFGALSDGLEIPGLVTPLPSAEKLRHVNFFRDRLQQGP